MWSTRTGPTSRGICSESVRRQLEPLDDTLWLPGPVCRDAVHPSFHALRLRTEASYSTSLPRYGCVGTVGSRQRRGMRADIHKCYHCSASSHDASFLTCSVSSLQTSTFFSALYAIFILIFVHSFNFPSYPLLSVRSDFATMSSELKLPDDQKPRPPPIPITPEATHQPRRKSFRKTLEGLIPVTPKYPDGLIPKSPTSPASIEKGPVLRRFTFIPLDVPGWDDGSPRMKRRTLVLLWVLGILVILGLSLGLGLGLGLKGLQGNGSATDSATTSNSAPTITQQAAMMAAAASTTLSPSAAASATASAAAGDDQTGKVLTVQQFFQPAFAVPANAQSATYTVAAPTATSGVGVVDCPSSNGTTYTSNGKKFMKMCYTDLPGPGVLNLDQITVNSLEHCIDACASYNGAKGSCSAVSYSANITQIYPQQHANCWLKDKSGEPKPGVWDQASAVLA